MVAPYVGLTNDGFRRTGFLGLPASEFFGLIFTFTRALERCVFLLRARLRRRVSKTSRETSGENAPLRKNSYAVPEASFPRGTVPEVGPGGQVLQILALTRHNNVFYDQLAQNVQGIKMRFETTSR